MHRVSSPDLMLLREIENLADRLVVYGQSASLIPVARYCDNIGSLLELMSLVARRALEDAETLHTSLS